MRTGRVRRILVLAAAVLASGCGVAERRAERYRVEQAIYRAEKDQTEAFLDRSRPDSATVLRVSEGYRRVRDVAKAPFLRGTEKERAIGRQTLQLVAAAQSQAARYQMMAARPDLAIASGEWIEANAEGDSMTMRRGDFVIAGALRGMGKGDEAVERLRTILRRYEPVPPPKGTSQEDELLAVPEMMAQVRLDAGDRDGAMRELDYGIGYYKGLLSKPRDPMLEALIRARIVRTSLELKRVGDATEQVAALERLVASNPELKSLTPELRYSRAKIVLLNNGRDPQGIAMLEQFARDFPKHSLAQRALFDAAVYLESAKRFPQALADYREVVARDPSNLEVAPAALFRQAMLEEQTGAWAQAKATLESIPVKYPRTQAALEAPITIAMRYYARGDKEAARAALARANATYREMIDKDSTSVWAVACRFNIVKGHMSLGEWDQALAAVDDMVIHNPRHPYTAQALLDAARVANANRQKDRAAGYLQQYLESFPGSPLAAQVRREKDNLLR